jgi:protein-arginine kinase activator protein McsA
MSKLEQLREELRLAVERDQFERAADLRDRLRDLERKQVSQKD